MSHPHRPKPNPRHQETDPDGVQLTKGSEPTRPIGKSILSKSQDSKLLDWTIDQLPGLSVQNQAQLINAGIQTTRQLLQRTRTPDQRQTLATQLQIHIQHLNKWVALANLARIPAVGCQYCGLLLHAGVSSPAQLAQTPIPRLHQQILRLHLSTLQRQDLCPDFGQVSEWIEQAKRVKPLKP